MFKKILYKTEPLEIDIKTQIDSISKNKKSIFFSIFIQKILKFFYFKFQRFFLKPNIRLLIGRLEKFLYREKFFEDSKNELSDKLKKNSFVKVENLFNSEEQKEITNYLSKNQSLIPIYTNHDDFELENPPKEISTGYIKTENILNCPHIIKGANNKTLINILNAYFGCKFKLDWIWAWWSFPSDNKIGPQNYHRDYESLNFVKVFVYLTNVDRNSGPHYIIKGSDKINKFYERKRFSDEKINSIFNEDSIIEISGSKGTTFMANTYAIHKGLLPKKNKRLVLVYLFSVVPSLRSPKIPPLKLSQLDLDTKNYVLKNKRLNSQFINFNL